MIRISNIKIDVLKDNEDYSIEIDTENEFEFNFGKWFYKYVFEEAELEKDLRYKNE